MEHAVFRALAEREFAFLLTRYGFVPQEGMEPRGVRFDSSAVYVGVYFDDVRDRDVTVYVVRKATPATGLSLADVLRAAGVLDAEEQGTRYVPSDAELGPALAELAPHLERHGRGVLLGEDTAWGEAVRLRDERAREYTAQYSRPPF